MGQKVLMKGNEAFGEAAIRAGCRFYVGYPITPQNELVEYMSRELPKRGGTFIQSESELATVNIAYGIGVAGGDVFISSASPGIALMQEGFSFACMAEVPMVAINVSRTGPGIGGIQPAQSDYYQMTRGGGNGDYHIPVFTPATMQEAIDCIYKSFAIANKYRNPVFIMADGMMGQMMEPVVLPEPRAPQALEKIAGEKPWALVGRNGKPDRNLIRAYAPTPARLEEMVHHLFDKYAAMEEELADAAVTSVEDAEIVFAAYGSSSRIVAEVLGVLKARGIRAGLIRPRTVWPFPSYAFDCVTAKTKVIASVELSMGQMLTDVERAVRGRFPVLMISRVGGNIPSSEDIAAEAEKILGEYK